MCACALARAHVSLHRVFVRYTRRVLTLSSSSFSFFLAFLQPAVPETALKRRKRDEAWAAKKAAASAEVKSNAEKSSKEIFKRAEKYVKEYRDQVRDAKAGSRGWGGRMFFSPGKIRTANRHLAAY